ncbi:hypothetical protein [Streptomyces lydicus]|uniref:hypothetical protein n=1 Tax=Streptomyces lydicus TaxID=47763 RepID=UPI0036E68AC9
MSNYSVNVFGDQGVVAFAEGKGTKSEILDFVATLPGWFAGKQGWTGGNIRLVIGRKTFGKFVQSLDDVVSFVTSVHPTYEFSEVTNTDAPESATVGTSTDKITDTKENDMPSVTTDEGAKVLEQINANIERAASLVEADNADGLAELNKETEALISSLSGKGSIKIKTDKRAEFKAAATAVEKPKGKGVATKDEKPEISLTDIEGVTELINMGAEKIAEGVRLHAKTSVTATEIAHVILDMWRRIPNKDGNPDILGDSDVAKKASGELYRIAGQGFERNEEMELALSKLQRSVQEKRADVRAEYLRGLDNEDATEEREHFAAILKDKPADVPASRWVADRYDTSLVGPGERKRLAYHTKKEDGSEVPEDLKPIAALVAAEGGKEESADDRIAALVKKLTGDVKKAKPEDFESASDEAKEKARADLEKLHKAIKDMIAATL